MRYLCFGSLLISFLLFFISVRKLRVSMGVASWPSVTGRIESFVVEEYEITARPPSYEVKATYVYEVAGETFRSSKVSVDNRLILNADRISRHFGSGEKVECEVWYNPEDPSDSVIFTPVWQGQLAITVLIGFWCFASVLWVFKCR